MVALHSNLPPHDLRAAAKGRLVVGLPDIRVCKMARFAKAIEKLESFSKSFSDDRFNNRRTKNK